MIIWLRTLTACLPKYQTKNAVANLGIQLPITRDNAHMHMHMHMHTLLVLLGSLSPKEQRPLYLLYIATFPLHAIPSIPNLDSRRIVFV